MNAKSLPPSAASTLLFDLDGTLTDNYAGITRSIRYALARLDGPEVDAATLRHCIGPPLRKTFARLLATDDSERIEHALTLYRERYSVDGWRENEVYAGIDTTLAALAGRGYRIMLCTSKPKVYAARIVAHFGFGRYLEAVYGAELGGRMDDKADLMAELLVNERLAASECVMVGDRAQDVIAANANGVRPLGVLWGYGSREELLGAGARDLLSAPSELLAAVA
ncbi:MAG: HAD hydrolase-like protein [Casimicrobiaceae bacterium]